MRVINNAENRELLAERVVTEADLDDVVEMAKNGCTSLYERDEAKFHEDWESIFGEREVTCGASQEDYLHAGGLQEAAGKSDSRAKNWEAQHTER